ncbi:OprO/OprP family phosphate-selective porin [Sulfurimonas sp.]|nr:OprO/OprP family phosphate-selective porin [Sulfurimonas sp.]
MKNIILILIFLSTLLDAANWLMIQGTESKIGHRPWGFLQLRFQDNSGKVLISNGVNKTPFSYIKPTLQKHSEFQVARARPGLRGSLDDANKINYFLLGEVAQNGVNNSLGTHTDNYLMDASITLKHLPLYIRLGRFKYAGSEEGNMARFVSPFIVFSTVGDQLMLERYLDTKTPHASNPDLYVAKPSEGVGAYRDNGIQLFQSFPFAQASYLTLSYMLGSGTGIKNDIDFKNHTHYGYLSYENILGKGKGYKQEAFKFYTWYQDGERDLAKRIRYGLGTTYFYDKLHLEAEYMKGKGMIYTGSKDTDASVNNNNWQYSMRASKENEADGYYVLGTYEVLKQLEIIARYDVYNRMTNIKSEHREFKTLTTGVSYRFKGYDRLDINYAYNEASAPHNQAANNILKSLGNLLSIQYTIVFK